MSALLDSIPGELIPASITPAQLQGNIKGKLTAQSWRVVAEDTSSVPCTLYVVPPASESIGNAQTREVLFFEFGGDYINLRPVCEALLAYPQTIALKENTLALGGGTNTNSLTLNGVTISQSPAAQAGNTALQNLRYLFEAMASSAIAPFADWTWIWNPYASQNGQSTYDPRTYIYGIRKTAAANQTVSVAGCLGGISGNYSAAGLQSASVSALQEPTPLTTDLASGFIVYLQVNARGLAIATRCNSGYYGAAHAVWGDHQFALDSMPVPSFGWEQFVSPIELLVGVDPSETNLSTLATGRTAKAWALAQCSNSLMANTTAGANAFTRVWPRGVYFDYAHSAIIGDSANPKCLISGLSEEAYLTLDDWPIHRVYGGAFTEAKGQNGLVRAAYVPAIKTDDWWRYHGTAPNENAQFGAKEPAHTTLVTALSRGGSETSITLASASGMPTAGAVIIEGEAIAYTGISTATLTGCTRGSYGTEKAAHAAGTPVSQGHYWVKINGGLLYCGLQAPS